jgi:catechol 2,3-dioxygenase-like lactoylglutathione lyase family enzyme
VGGFTLFDQQITFLYTRDLSTTARFYEQVLGLPLDRDQGDCRIYRVSSTGLIGFCQRELDSPAENHPIILTFIAEDVDGWYRTLQERGVRFEAAPVLNPKYHIYHCFLRDPNGYLLEIQTFLDAAE